jgi:uncharacterized protein YqeY
MKVLEKLQKAKITAMKSKDSIGKSILSLLHSDALNIAKKDKREVEEDDILKSAKSLIKKNKQAISDAQANLGATLPHYEKENEILADFLPEQINTADMELAIDGLLEAFPEEERTRKIQGQLMKSLKEKFGNTIDMGAASKYIGTKL